MRIDTLDLRKNGGADPTGTASTSATIQAMLALGHLHIPDGDWKVTTEISVPAGRRLTMSPGARLIVPADATQNNVFTLDGSIGSFAAVGNALATTSETVSFSGGVGSLAVGDLIVIRSSDTTLAHDADPYPAELRKVEGISGTSVTLDQPLGWPHTTPFWAKMTPAANNIFEGIRVHNEGSLLVRQMTATYTRDVKIEGWHVDNVAGAIGFINAWCPSVDGFTQDGSVWTASNGVDNFRGYGVYFRGQTSFPKLTNAHATGGRHLITTNVDANNYGGVTDMLVSDSTSSGEHAGFDTHQGVNRATFNNCHTTGVGIYGLQGRGDRVSFIGCSARRRQTAAFNFTNGGIGHRIVGCHADRCAVGVRLNPADYDIDVEVIGTITTNSYTAPTVVETGSGTGTITTTASSIA